MHRICLTALLSVWPVMAPADASRGATTGLRVMPLEDGTLEQLRWQTRPVVVLGPGEAADAQIAALQAWAAELQDRAVVILTDGPGAEPLRRGAAFRVLLIGKDGGVKLRRDRPVDASEIIGLIDTMPMRQREAAADPEPG
ncbi:DUF4174 domain-containing protein [Paracoccus beibuensis]|uniref:DUF4174 domain-containing protein n=1 Tax=Paracoccus beibuensis TaxID=547602 RepID=UPI00223EB60F|nr:DUF4174 domain-containing protein [Paracoccus beibuensis]